MDINKILAQLRAERDELTKAILALEGLGGKRRGRRPNCMKAIIEESTQAKPKKQIARSKDEKN